MLPRFIGRISGLAAPPTPDRHRPDTTGYTIAEFSGGFVAHRPGVSVHRNERMLCLAVGTPRFQQPELDALALDRGIAAAWIQAFEQYGADTPAHLAGRHAAILIDLERRRATLVADRFGSWPICYAVSENLLEFSDRADAVPGSRRGLSAQAIYDYLYFHMIPAPQTLFEGVQRLPAAHWLNWSPEVPAATQPWWRPRFREHERPDLETSKRHFLDLVQKSVAREAAGHRVGTFLSGGTDSSTVSGMLCKVLGEPAQAYSIGFDANGYDEMEYARITARHFGLKHHEYYVTADDLLEGIPTVARHYDQPFGNSSAVPAWICARNARSDGIDKLLAGDGGDELFGGNVRYAKQRILGWYEETPSWLRRVALEPFPAVPGVERIPLLRKVASYVEQAKVPLPDRMQMYNLVERLGGSTLFEPGFVDRIDPTAVLMQQRETWDFPHADSQLNRTLAWDWKYTLADNDLPKVIGTTDLAGVDVGFPLLSDELVEFSMALPPAWKLRGFTLRWFFKEALRGFLPDEIIAKKKHGFGLPFGIWACQHAGLKTLAGDTLQSLKARDIIRPAFIDELIDTHLPAHPGYYGEMVWILMMLELWMQSHQESSD